MLPLPLLSHGHANALLAEMRCEGEEAKHSASKATESTQSKLVARASFRITSTSVCVRAGSSKGKTAINIAYIVTPQLHISALKPYSQVGMAYTSGAV